MCMFCRSLFVPFLLAIVLSFLLRFMDSDYPFGIFKLFYKMFFAINLYFHCVSFYCTHTMSCTYLLFPFLWGRGVIFCCFFLFFWVFFCCYFVFVFFVIVFAFDLFILIVFLCVIFRKGMFIIFRVIKCHIIMKDVRGMSLTLSTLWSNNYTPIITSITEL